MLHHRNHLSLLVDTISIIQGGTAEIDFTGAEGGIVLGEGVNALAAGNADSTDQAIFASDLAVIHANWPILSMHYLNSDVNLDGTTDLLDYTLCKTNMLNGLYSKGKQ